MMRMGRLVPSSCRVMWGTAMPTKDTGPASAVTQADSRLDKRISPTRNRRTFTPMVAAYSSPRA